MHVLICRHPCALIDVESVQKNCRVFHKPADNRVLSMKLVIESALELTQKGSNMILNPLHRSFGTAVTGRLAYC